MTIIKRMAALLAVFVLCFTAMAEADPTEMPTVDEEVADEETVVEDEASEEGVQGRLDGLIIGIDPGHQEHQNSGQEPMAPGSSKTKNKVASGTSGRATGTPEYVVDLDVSLLLRDALEREGATVYMTRVTNDVDISNMERALMMNEVGADLVLRIHCNGNTDRSVHGIGLYVNKTGDIAEPSYGAAQVIIEHMLEKTGARRDGIFRRDTYTGLNWSTVPCILVEMGYMSNYDEDLKLEDPEYQQLLVDGMVAGIAEWFGR